MFYLAAAISDFYIPWGNVPTHKLQSRDGPLDLKLQQVPKCLGALRSEWAPEAFHVSFKLETDEQLLLNKSKQSICNYGVHCVIANELSTRTERCAAWRSRVNWHQSMLEHALHHCVQRNQSMCHGCAIRCRRSLLGFCGAESTLCPGEMHMWMQTMTWRPKRGTW
jgi:hypothetical protein